MQVVQGFNATLDDLVYMPGLDVPPERPHSFVYFVTITNDTPEFLTVVGRKWVVRENSGDCIVVEGEGVVGKNRDLLPEVVLVTTAITSLGLMPVSMALFSR
jgi:ApaG protein